MMTNEQAATLIEAMIEEIVDEAMQGTKDEEYANEFFGDLIEELDDAATMMGDAAVYDDACSFTAIARHVSRHAAKFDYEHGTRIADKIDEWIDDGETIREIAAGFADDRY